MVRRHRRRIEPCGASHVAKYRNFVALGSQSQTLLINKLIVYIIEIQSIKIKGAANMTERQKTGVWFVITGVLLLSLWCFAYAIVNSSINSGLTILDSSNFTDEQGYVIGAAGVASLQFASLTGVPLIVTGLAQIITGTQKAKKKSSKK